MIYFDQAASTFPKPPEVAEAVYEAITTYSANPGRGSHALARKAATIVDETRSHLASFLGCSDPKQVLFCSSATHAINLALKGFPFESGDHVIATSFEHNAVRRPLEAVREEKGIEVTYINPLAGNPQVELGKAINGHTKLLVLTHASNLTGQIFPLDELVDCAKENGINVLLDASQTAGILPINMQEQSIDMVAVAGHKGLLGPQGIGALLVEGNIELTPQVQGGTGYNSHSIEQPDIWPEKFESGTLNIPGIAGLKAAIQALEDLGLEEVVSRETLLVKHCLTGLNEIEGITVYGPKSLEDRLGVIAFNVDGISSQEIALILDQHYQIAVRAGIHCTPLSHEVIGTISIGGAVRVSFSIYNTKEEVDTFLQAMKEIVEGLQGGI